MGYAFAPDLKRKQARLCSCVILKPTHPRFLPNAEFSTKQMPRSGSLFGAGNFILPSDLLFNSTKVPAARVAHFQLSDGAKRRLCTNSRSLVHLRSRPTLLLRSLALLCASTGAPAKFSTPPSLIPSSAQSSLFTTTASPLRPMASDDDYMAFLNKANQDPGDGYAKAANSTQQKGEFKATDTGAQVPAVLTEAVRNAFYVSDADEPFVPVCLSWDEAGKGLPDEGEFDSPLFTSKLPLTAFASALSLFCRSSRHSFSFYSLAPPLFSFRLFGFTIV